jgi:hypothetical protein
MKHKVAKLLDFNKNKEVSGQSFPEIPPRNTEEISDVELSEDFKEAIIILGLNQPAFSFSEDYGWMIETTKQILLNDGVEYFRKNVLTLMNAWDKFSKS